MLLFNRHMMLLLTCFWCAQNAAADVVLRYNPMNGNVMLDAATMVESFNVFSLREDTSAPPAFNYAAHDFSDFTGGFDATNAMNGEISLVAFNSFGGVADIGNVFPLGLTKMGVESLLQHSDPVETSFYQLTGDPTKRKFLVVVPEASQILTLLLCGSTFWVVRRWIRPLPKSAR